MCDISPHPAPKPRPMTGRLTFNHMGAVMKRLSGCSVQRQWRAARCSLPRCSGNELLRRQIHPEIILCHALLKVNSHQRKVQRSPNQIPSAGTNTDAFLQAQTISALKLKVTRETSFYCHACVCGRWFHVLLVPPTSSYDKSYDRLHHTHSSDVGCCDAYCTGAGSCRPTFPFECCDGPTWPDECCTGTGW